MKKFVNYFLLASLFVAGLTGLAACSSSDDDDEPGSSGTLETPKYESVSAKYIISDLESDIQSVELTESGNYVIVRRGYELDVKGAQTAQVQTIPLFFGRHATTRASVPQIIEGKYTKISDTEFDLIGYGHITVTGAADNAVALVITPNSGTAFTLHAARTEQKSNSDLTNKLCRTWTISSLRLQISVGNEEILNSEHKITELSKFKEDYISVVKKMYSKQGYSLSDEEARAMANEMFADDFDDEDTFTPSRVIFTKAGSYMVQYTNGELALSTWSWLDESKGIIRYSWNYEDLEDEYMGGNVYVSFRGAQMAIREGMEVEGMTENVTIYFDEVK